MDVVNSDENTTVEEINELIAIRVPPGDRWKLINTDGQSTSDEVIDGIVEAMSVYMRTRNYYGDYRLAPLDNGGRIYIIKKVEVQVEKPPVKKYDLYGER